MSNKFYTFVGTMDDAIYHRYYDENKNVILEKVEEYDYALYVEHHSESSNYKTLNNKDIKEFKFSKLSEMSKFYKENKDTFRIHGNDTGLYQFISKEYNYDVRQTADVSILNFDIEVEHGDGLQRFELDHQIKIKNKETGNEFYFNYFEMKKVHKKQESDLYLVYDENINKWVDYQDSSYYQEAIGFPDPYEAKGEILSISLKQFGKDKLFYSLGTKPLAEYDNPKGRYIQCKDEKELLVYFIKLWREIDPEIITGWNIDGYDIPYLINRIKKILGKKALAYLSPFKDKVKNNDKLITERAAGDKIVYEIFGITSYDYIELYKKYNSTKRESYKLDYIGEVEIDQKKVNFDEYKKSLMNLYNGDIVVDLKTPFNELDETMKFARIREVAKMRLKQLNINIENGMLFKDVHEFKFDLNDFDLKKIAEFDNETLKGLYNFCDERVRTLSYKKFIMYNEQDANIVELLDMKQNFIRLAIRVAHMTKSRFKDIYGTVSPWDNMIYSRLLSKNIQIPPRESFEKDDKFTGAYVKDPVLGHHKWIVSFDYASLYPSIIRLLKISPESLIKGQDANRFDTLNKILNHEYNTEDIKAKNYAVAANGAVFDQSIEGVLPETMKYLMEERNSVKSTMKDKDRQLQKIKTAIAKKKQC